MKWDDGVYPILEKEILSKALRWKTDLTSPAQIIFLIACVFKEQCASNLSGFDHVDLTCVLQESLFRSYIAMLGKLLSKSYLYLIFHSRVPTFRIF